MSDDDKEEKETVGKDKDSVDETPADPTATNVYGFINASPRSPDYPTAREEEVNREIHHKQCMKIATPALDYYNKLHGTKFKLVEDYETMDSRPILDNPKIWMHCSFHAMEDFSISPFFAEVKYHPSPLVVTTCQKLIDGETKDGCEYCHFIHPVNGFQVGFVDNSTTASHAMSADGEDRLMGLDLDKELVQEDTDSGNETPADPTATNEYGFINASPRSPDYPTAREEEVNREIHHKQCMKIATPALDYYNKLHGTKFKLVEDYETMDSRPILDNPKIWMHCSFHAMEDSSITPFFAEVKYHPSPLVVTTCQKLIDGETKDGCEYCHFIHPVNGLRVGFVDNSTTASHAMSDDGEDRLMDLDLDKELVQKDTDSGNETPADPAATNAYGFKYASPRYK